MEQSYFSEVMASNLTSELPLSVPVGTYAKPPKLLAIGAAAHKVTGKPTFDLPGSSPFATSWCGPINSRLSAQSIAKAHPDQFEANFVNYAFLPLSNERYSIQ